MTFQAGQYPLQIQHALAPVTAVSIPPHQGMTSFVTFAETGLGSVVVKRAAGPRLEALRRERDVLERLAGLALPIPEALLYLEIETDQGLEGWLVMRRLPGEPLQKILRAAGDPNLRAQLLQNLGSVLAQLHASPVPPALSADSDQWLDHMLELAEANLALGIGEGSREQLKALKAQRPAPVAPALIHGDLFLDNVLSDGTVVTGLIDWAFGAAGDPRYDLAIAMHGLTGSDRSAFLDGYGIAGGLSAFETNYFLTLAVFY